MYAVAFGQVLHVFWSWLFVIHWGYGIEGTGYAAIITNMTILFATLFYTYLLEDIREAIFWPDARTFQGLKE